MKQKRDYVNRIYKVIQSNNTLRNLELKFSPKTHPGHSLTFIVFFKVRIIFEAVLRTLVGGLRPLRAIAKTRTFGNSRKTKVALVLGNSPANTRLNFSSIFADCSTGALDLFVVNSFPLEQIEKAALANTYLVLSDPDHSPANPLSRSLWEKVSKKPSLNLVVPATWAQNLADLQIRNQTLCFNDLSLQGVTKNTNPLLPRGYSSNTGFKALAFAHFMGYKRIYISGMDYSFYLGLTVDGENHLHQSDVYMEPMNSRRSVEVTNQFHSGTSDFFYDLSQLFYDLKQVLRFPEVQNLNPTSLVDAYPKVNYPIKYVK